MAQFETYFDSDLGQLRPVLYTWDDTNDSSANWDNATSWHNWLNVSITSTPGTPDIEFRTEIIDLGRIDDVNPLCEVRAVGTVSVNVHVADQIDSSSLLPGDPAIQGGQSQDLDGQQGRYFQFTIQVEGTNPSISSVRTTLSATKQTEFIQGDSSSHSGSTSERIIPIAKEYSKISAVLGTALYDGTGEDSAGATGSPYVNDNYVLSNYFETVSGPVEPSDIPIVIVRSTTSKTQPKYAVFTSNGTLQDHYVYLQVAGLPKLSSDADGNIVEG